MPWSYGSGHSACHRSFVGSFCVGIDVLAEPHRSICKSLGLSQHSPLFCSISLWYSPSHILFSGHLLQFSAYLMQYPISCISSTPKTKAQPPKWSGLSIYPMIALYHITYGHCGHLFVNCWIIPKIALDILLAVCYNTDRKEVVI